MPQPLSTRFAICPKPQGPAVLAFASGLTGRYHEVRALGEPPAARALPLPRISPIPIPRC